MLCNLMDACSWHKIDDAIEMHVCIKAINRFEKNKIW